VLVKAEAFRAGYTILASYNEERFIAGCLEHLFVQGVESYLIDNSSTDRTVEIAERFLGWGLIGIESFPREGDIFRWGDIAEDWALPWKNKREPGGPEISGESLAPRIRTTLP
jgi:hypothetical protein